MSEQERRWTRDDGVKFRTTPQGQLERLGESGKWTISGFTIADMEYGYPASLEPVTETFDHLPNPIPPPLVSAAEMITAFRRFRAEVVQAAQTVSNSKLPHAIFQADDELAKIVPRMKAEP
jgi:hypothetical protein